MLYTKAARVYRAAFYPEDCLLKICFDTCFMKRFHIAEIIL